MKILDFICGIAAGWSQIIVGQPLDYIKVKYQVDTHVKDMSIFEVAKQIRNEHGYKGFYRGSSSLFLGMGLIMGVQFAVYEFTKRWLYRIFHKIQSPSHEELNKSAPLVYKDGVLSIFEISVAGGIVGMSSSLIFCPVQYVKIQKQMNSKGSEGSMKILINQIAENGIKNISKGLMATILRQVIGTAVYFSSYEYFLRSIVKNEQSRQDISNVNFAIAGGIGGLVYWTVCYPIDVVKTNVQNGKSYKDAIRDATGGMKSFKGLNAVLIRSVLANGASFTVYENLRSLLGLHDGGQGH